VRVAQEIRGLFFAFRVREAQFYREARKNSTYCIFTLVIVGLLVAAGVRLSWATRVDNATLSWPPALLLILWIVIGVATGVVVHLVFSLVLNLVRRRPRAAARPHEIASHFFGVVGVIYAVLVAFVVVTAWQVRTRAEDLMIGEQHNVDYLFHLDVAYPNHQARLTRYLLRDYAVDTSAEWGQMERGIPLCGDISEIDVNCFGPLGAVSERANRLVHCIVELTVGLPAARPDSRFKPTSELLQRNQAIYQEDIATIKAIIESREERRLRYNERTLQPILWTAFLLGALILAAMTYLISGQERAEQLIRTCALFGMVGMMSAIALVFDRPYSGTTHVDGHMWAAMVKHFDSDLGNPKPPYSNLPNECLTKSG
jgi:flagellar biosynthesis protein FliQ